MKSKTRYKFVQNPVTHRCHMLEHGSLNTYCDTLADDDFTLRHNYPANGIMCGGCLRVRRKRRRRVT